MLYVKDFITFCVIAMYKMKKNRYCFIINLNIKFEF